MSRQVVATPIVAQTISHASMVIERFTRLAGGGIETVGNVQTPLSTVAGQPSAIPYDRSALLDGSNEGRGDGGRLVHEQPGEAACESPMTTSFRSTSISSHLAGLHAKVTQRGEDLVAVRGDAQVARLEMYLVATRTATRVLLPPEKSASSPASPRASPAW